MAVTKFLARDLAMAISTDPGVDTIPGNTDDTWTPIGGIESLTHSPATEKADATDFDSNGRAEHLAVQRGDSWTLAGFALEDVSTGDPDPGQDACASASKLTGLGSLVWFQLTSPGGNTIRFEASVEVTQAGGGHNDLAKWQAVIEVSGTPAYA